LLANARCKINERKVEFLKSEWKMAREEGRTTGERNPGYLLDGWRSEEKS